MTTDNKVSREDMNHLYELSNKFLPPAGCPPISFVYDGVSYSGVPAGWEEADTSYTIVDANIVKYTFTARAPGTGLTLTIELFRYKDFPAVEWTAYFKNAGNSDTPIISDLRVYDGLLAAGGGELIQCNGDFYDAAGYTPSCHPLASGEEYVQVPHGGRSCDRAFPYQRLLMDGWGLNIAIGWPGEWRTRYSHAPGGISLEAGQNVIGTYLKPGETLRSPRITILAFAGDERRGINLWRSFYRAHVLPRHDGQIMGPMLQSSHNGGGIEFTEANESNQLEYIEKHREAGFELDIWWIDAGWYPCRVENGEKRWGKTGSWFHDPDRFPNTFKPISDKLRESGTKLLVWFEPERVQVGTWLYENRPEWLLDDGRDSNDRLLNLADPDCLDQLKHYVSDFITQNGIGIYRQDFNFEPVGYWRANEAGDRRGMLENLHIQGYLAYWDFLLMNHPDLIIDSCASGGRRNDVETMRRAIPLHQTDYGYGNHPVKQSFYQTLYEWIPYCRGFMQSTDDDAGEYHEYNFRDELDNFTIVNAMMPCLAMIYDERSNDYVLKMARIWREAAPYIIDGDYYALTPFHKSSEMWTVWQFSDPVSGRGILQVMRNLAAPDETITVRPHDFDPAGRYTFKNPETGEEFSLSGRQIEGDGLTLALPRRTGAVWFYERAPG